MTSLVHTIEEAKRMIEDIASPAVGIVADTFHMNIEEDNGVINGIYSAGRHLGCLHLGDNNRKPPSSSSALDWNAILKALRDIGFEGTLSHEPIELYYSEVKAATDKRYMADLVARIKQSIEYIRQCVVGIGDNDNKRIGG